MNKITIETEISQISELHYNYLKTGFITSLGIEFLNILYRHINNSNFAFYHTLKVDNKIIGFVAGTTDIKKFYVEFIKKNFFKVLPILLPKVFNYITLKRIIETLFYPAKIDIEKDIPKPELLSIVVDEKYQGKGVAEELFKEHVNEFKNRNIKEFKIIVGSNLDKAIRFYEKMGSSYFGKIQVHKGEDSFIYVYKISG